MPMEFVNYCPYGCQDSELDGDTGYCRHLVGFTNDGKIGELLQRVERVDRAGNKFFTFAQVTGKKIFKVTAACKLINPEIVVGSVGHRVQQRALKWLSSRVYHPSYENTHFLPPPESQPEDLPTFFDLPKAPPLPPAQAQGGLIGGRLL